MAFIRKGSQYKVGDVYYNKRVLNSLSEGVLEQSSVVKLVTIKGDSKFLFEDMESHEIFTLSDFEIDNYLVNISNYVELFSASYTKYDLFTLLIMLSHCMVERKRFVQAKFYACIFTPALFIVLTVLTLVFSVTSGLSKCGVIIISLVAISGALEIIALIDLFRGKHELNCLKEANSEYFNVVNAICVQDVKALDCILDLL